MKWMSYGTWNLIWLYAETCNGWYEIFKPRPVFKVCTDLYTIGVFDECRAKDVVEVQVRAEEILEVQLILFDELAELPLLLVPVHSRVYHGCFARLLIVYNVTVLMQHIANECLYFHGAYIFDIPCEDTLFVENSQRIEGKLFLTAEEKHCHRDGKALSPRRQKIVTAMKKFYHRGDKTFQVNRCGFFTVVSAIDGWGFGRPSLCSLGDKLLLSIMYSPIGSLGCLVVLWSLLCKQNSVGALEKRG